MRDRILIVEDNPDVSDVISEALAEAGFKVRRAGCSSEASAILKSDEELDLLLTDIDLSGENGSTLARYARAVRPQIAVIYTTGWGHLMQGEHDAPILPKPFSMTGLIELVRASIG